MCVKSRSFVRWGIIYYAQMENQYKHREVKKLVPDYTARKGAELGFELRPSDSEVHVLDHTALMLFKPITLAGIF